MIKIFLCSSLADAAQLLSKFVVQLQRKIVAFIPTASINEEHTQYVVDGKTALKYLGLVVKELGALCDEKSIPQIIKDSDRIYISERGNSFFFTYGLRRTELIVDSRGCWKSGGSSCRGDKRPRCHTCDRKNKQKLSCSF